MRTVEEEKNGRKQPESGREGPAGPADEYEALRMQLLAGLRRHPADGHSLMRNAEALSRMASAEKRMSPSRARDLGERVVRAMKGFEDQLVRPDN